MRSWVTATLIIWMVCSSCAAIAQQMADLDYTPPPFSPRYQRQNGPVITIDEAHNNFHTADGRYAPFAKLLRSDGYRISRGTSPFSEAQLKRTGILVIANAINASNLAEWRLPTPSAFTKQEIEAVRSWVSRGGSVFLIADHMPFAGAAADMAAAFGFTFYNGFAFDSLKMDAPDIFTRAGHSFSDEAIQTTPRPQEPLDSIASFTGQGFDIPAKAKSILTLGGRFKIFLCEEAWNFDRNTTTISGKGKSQGAALLYGKGKIVVFGEAAMFSAQVANGTKAGMNHALAGNNYKLLLEIVHWLDN